MQKKQDQKQMKIFRDNEAKPRSFTSPFKVGVNAIQLGYCNEKVQRLYDIHVEMDA